MTEQQRCFLERAFWMLMYGAMVLMAANRLDSLNGWIVVIGMALFAGAAAAQSAGPISE